MFETNELERMGSTQSLDQLIQSPSSQSKFRKDSNFRKYGSMHQRKAVISRNIRNRANAPDGLPFDSTDPRMFEQNHVNDTTAIRNSNNSNNMSKNDNNTTNNGYTIKDEKATMTNKTREERKNKNNSILTSSHNANSKRKNLKAVSKRTTVATTSVSSENPPHLPIIRTASLNAPSPNRNSDFDGLILKYSDLVVGNELGRGGFGVVFKGSLHASPVAIKQLHFTVSDNQEFYNEINVMRRVRHPNVVLFLGATVSPDPMCIVTEFVSKGSLHNVIHNKKRHLNKTKILQYSLDVSRGMNYLHHSGIIHLDLKPDNVLVTESDVCKVADFGLSKISGSYANSVTNKGGGTVVYTAPEVYRGARITNQVDIFSFGIMLWELYYREKPYDGMNQHAICFKTVSEDYRPIVKEDDLPYLYETMKLCWDKDPIVRPTFDELIKIIEDQQDTKIKPHEDEPDDSISDSQFLELSKDATFANRPPDVDNWDEQHVISWLRDIDLGFAIENFIGQNINGVVLRTLSNSDLEGLGFDNFGHRRRLYVAIQNLSINPSLENVSALTSSSVSSLPRKNEIPAIVADHHVNKHGCVKVTPGTEVDCSFCNDSFEDDYEVGWKCLTCDKIFHDICFDESIQECTKPSVPVVAPTSSASNPDFQSHDESGYLATAALSNMKGGAVPASTLNITNINSAHHSHSFFRGSTKRRMTITTLNSAAVNYKPHQTFSEFSAAAIAHVTGSKVTRGQESFIFKRYFRQGVDFKLSPYKRLNDQDSWEDMIISYIRVARSECAFAFINKDYVACAEISQEIALSIIAACHDAMEPVKLDLNLSGSQTLLFNGARDSLVQLATNVRDQLQSTVNKAQDESLTFQKRATIFYDSLTSILQYLIKRESISRMASKTSVASLF